MSGTGRTGAESEPWFYGFIAGYARVYLVLGILATFTGGAVLAMTHADLLLRPVPGVTTQEIVLRGAMALAFGLGLFLAILGLAFQVGLVLLFVDMGRNLRRIRANTQGR